MDETIENINEIADTGVGEFCSEAMGDGIVGKIVKGVVVATIGVAAGFAINKRAAICEFIENKKQARNAKKAAKLMRKLNKIKPVEKTENEKTEEE